MNLKASNKQLFTQKSSYLPCKYDAYYKQTNWVCISCEKTITVYEARIHCADCPQQESFNICISCYGKKNEKKWEQEHLEINKHEFNKIKMRKHQGYMNWLVCCPSSAETLKRAFMYYSDRKCLGEREKKMFKGQEIVGNYKWKYFGEIWESLKFTGCGLTHLNTQVSNKRGFVGICSINRTDWFVADWACVYNGMVSVPLARTRFLVDDLSGGIATINNAECFAIVCSSEVIEKIIEASCETPSLKYIIQMEPLNQKFSSKVQKFISQSKVKVISLSDVQKIGMKYFHDIIEIKPNDLRTIVYTRY
jgi:hypothetical protein